MLTEIASKRDSRLIHDRAPRRQEPTHVLLIEDEGEYAFHAGAPTPEGERPDSERAHHARWRVTLKRGAKTWTRTCDTLREEVVCFVREKLASNPELEHLRCFVR